MKPFHIVFIVACLLCTGIFGSVTPIRIDGSTSVSPLMKSFAENFLAENQDIRVAVSESNTTSGVAAFLGGLCDITMISRPLTKGEITKAVEKGIQPYHKMIAYDAIVPIVHPSSPVTNLTQEQLRKIYTGRVINWMDVGGANAPIVVITREAGSGSRSFFLHAVMPGEQITPAAQTLKSATALKNRVAATPGAIAVISSGCLDETVKATALNGISPDPLTIQTGIHPLSRRLFIVTRQIPPIGSHIFRFVNFYLSRQGQAIIASKGYVPVTHYHTAER